MDDALDLPIAVRRTRRSLSHSVDSTAQPKQSPSASPARRPAQARQAARTPKSRKRRVRFSDPGPDSTGTADEPSATGLTPMICRAALSSSRPPRRHSTPARLLHTLSSSRNPNLVSQGSPFSGEVHFLPLRQVLDGRVKRRIRRNGLSEEMNTISAERKRRAEETKAEIERLKAELAARDEEIARLHDETVVLDTDRVWDLEQEVAALKRELAGRSGVQHLPSSPAYEWTRAARGSYSDDFMELDIEGDDQDFGETTRAELLCSTPTRRMVRASASFPTPPATSPAPQLPQTPCRRLPTPRSSLGVQASLPDPEKRQLEQELESLQLEVNKLTATLESYSALTSRLSDKLRPFSPHPPTAEQSSEKPEIEAHLTTVLQALSDRTAALAELDSSLKTLGFPGSDGFEVIDSLRSAFRSARLELEYITPGEITLPLTGAGAEVLDMVLTQLRDLAKKNRDADDSIDEYHAIEFSLRQQLNARVTAMDNLAARLSSAERESQQNDARINELEIGLDRLKNAVRTYTRDISELEALVQRMETDLAASNSARDTATAALADKMSAISSLEERLATAIAQSNELQSELSTLTVTHAQTQAIHKEALASLTASHNASLAQRDARIAELSAEVKRVEALLREAQETMQKQRAENGRLTEANDALKEENARGRKTAEEVVAGMKSELERVVKMGEGFLGSLGFGAGTAREGAEARSNEVETTASGAGRKVGRLVMGDVVGSDRGSKRRKFDSGLGFLDEEDVDEAV